MGKRKGFSRRRAAAIRLEELCRVARFHVAWGEILNPVPWLKVFANVLSSAPPKRVGTRADERPPEFFGLKASTLSRAMWGAGIRASQDQVQGQVAETHEWRKKESMRLGRPHYVAMRGDTIGHMLGITEIVRLETKAWGVIPFGMKRKDLVEQYRERNREREMARRISKGAKMRGVPLTKSRPWEKFGMSRRTWERRRSAGALPPEPVMAIPISRDLH